MRFHLPCSYTLGPNHARRKTSVLTVVGLLRALNQELRRVTVLE